MEQLHLLIQIQLWQLPIAFPLQGIEIKHTNIPSFRIHSLCEVSRAREMQNFQVCFKIGKALKQYLNNFYLCCVISVHYSFPFPKFSP